MVKFSRYISNMTPVFRIFRSVKTYLLCASIYLGWQASSVYAHPHMWVDLDTQVELTAENKVTAIHQRWLFDDFFSTSVIEDSSLYPGGTNAGIQNEIERITEALKPYNYYTEIEMGGKKLSSTLVGDISWEVIDNRIKMSFTVAPNESSVSDVQGWSYAIFDPTYYIEMLHAEGSSITIEGDLAQKCSSWIEQPNPSADAVALSQSTILDNNADDTVGRFFAETVHVSC